MSRDEAGRLVSDMTALDLGAHCPHFTTGNRGSRTPNRSRTNLHGGWRAAKVLLRSAVNENDPLESVVNEQVATRAAELIRCCKVAALGTLHDGQPSVSMIPYAIIGEPFAFIVLASTLAAHTAEMLHDPSVSLMIMEPEADTKLSHALARVSIQGRAGALPADDPRFGSARAAYSARFPEMAGLFGLGDFALFAITPERLRFVGGFAQAATLTPAAVAGSLRERTGLVRSKEER